MSCQTDAQDREGDYNTNTDMVVSVLTILKNPMILLGLVSMGLFFGMPKLVENSKSMSQDIPSLFMERPIDYAQQWIPRCALSGKSNRRATR